MSKCELFKTIAETVWDRLASSNESGVRIDERGITSDRVVSSIQDFIKQKNRFQIFAQLAKKEVNTGGDLELYIEDGYQQFIRILLQAKRSEKDGDLINLKKESGNTGRRQYNTLLNYSNRIHSKAFYIIYNGIPDYYCNEVDCHGRHNEKQYGCSIVDPYVIKSHCETTNSSSISFNRATLPMGKPWRYLVCCDKEDYSEYRRYRKEEIDMDPYFQKLFTPPPPISFITSFSDFGDTELEKLNKKNAVEGWAPDARIIVTNHSKMKKNGELLELVNI